MAQDARGGLLNLLRFYADSAYAKGALAYKIADAAFMMRHLYEDLDLPSRAHMNALMQTHYPALAAMKPRTIRWKKYLFDCIESTAPACVACGDKAHCFSCDLTLAQPAPIN